MVDEWGGEIFWLGGTSVDGSKGWRRTASKAALAGLTLGSHGWSEYCLVASRLQRRRRRWEQRSTRSLPALSFGLAVWSVELLEMAILWSRLSCFHTHFESVFTNLAFNCSNLAALSSKHKISFHDRCCCAMSNDRLMYHAHRILA